MKSVDMAVWAAGRGWTVVKIRPGSKKAAEKWRDLGYRAPSAVREAWGGKAWSVGILTGPSNLVCDDLDVDAEGNPAGDWALADLATDAGHELPRTFTLATPSGGTQLIWQSTNGREYKTCAGQVGDHIDVRGHGGLFVLFDPRNPARVILDDREPAPIPEWLAELHPEPGDVIGSGRMISVPNTSAWINAHGGGKQCEVMADTCHSWAEKLERDPNLHDWMTGAVYSLVGDAVVGHRGLSDALKYVRDAFYKGMHGKSREHDKIEDWENAINGAIAKKLGRVGGHIFEEDPCAIDDEPFDPYHGQARDGVYIDDVEDRDVEWLCKPWFPFASLVIIDGDPGQGKSMMTSKVVANASAGIEILPSSESYGQPIRCGLIASEDDDYIIKGRLRAAGYKFDRSVVVMNTRYRGKYLKFPEGVKRVRKFIVENNLDLLIIDPISQYIGEKIQTHNESSVRDALGPISEMAQETGACIVMVRHMNKNSDLKAMYRGGGSIAFSALARSGMITGELPNGRYALAHVKCSYAQKFPGALAYSVASWEENEEIPVIEWHGEEDIDVNELAKGPRARKGPEPTSQNAIREVLEQLFETKDTWPQKEVMQNLTDAGCSNDPKTIGKVRVEMGIIARPVMRSDKKYAGWEWTIKESKQSVRRDSRDSKDSSSDEKGPFDE